MLDHIIIKIGIPLREYYSNNTYQIKTYRRILYSIFLFVQYYTKLISNVIFENAC